MHKRACLRGNRVTGMLYVLEPSAQCMHKRGVAMLELSGCNETYIVEELTFIMHGNSIRFMHKKGVATCDYC